MINWKDKCIDCKYQHTCSMTEEDCVLIKGNWKKIPREDNVDGRSK